MLNSKTDTPLAASSAIADVIRYERVSDMPGDIVS